MGIKPIALPICSSASESASDPVEKHGDNHSATVGKLSISDAGDFCHHNCLYLFEKINFQ
jgi:hypothetical protein